MSLAGLNSLTTIGGNLAIDNNGSLTRFAGLDSLASVEGYLYISNNAALTNLDGLSSLTSVGSGFEITNNYVLSACSCGIGALLASEGIAGTITINNNLPGCNSAAEILATPCETTTGIESPSNVPEHFTLAANYPNPFNPQTTIRYALPELASVRLVVFDAMGRRVRVLVDERQQPGWHEVVFDGGALPSGMYFYRLEASSLEESSQMLLIK